MDTGIEHTILGQSRYFRYSDIQSVQISPIGYVWFKLRGDDTLYGFTGTGLKEIVSVLEAKGVEVSAKERHKLRYAVTAVRAVVVFGVVFMMAWAAGLWYGILQILLLVVSG